MGAGTPARESESPPDRPTSKCRKGPRHLVGAHWVAGLPSTYVYKHRSANRSGAASEGANAVPSFRTFRIIFIFLEANYGYCKWPQADIRSSAAFHRCRLSHA